MSQQSAVEYARSAAQAAEGPGDAAGLAAGKTLRKPFALKARRAVPAPNPQGPNRSSLEAPDCAPRGLRRAALRPPARQPGAHHSDGQDMLDAAPDLEETKSRLAEAADALRRLSMNGIKPGALRAQWPDVVRQAEEAYGWTAERVRPPRPTPAQITRMDEAISWLLWLDGEERKVVWARSIGMSWRRIEDMDGRSVRTLQNLFAGALRRILARRRA